ncbi:nucleotidyltransferase [Pelagibius litoralis]|uniref:Nucleotidyltransferase n=2 Tax=Pelagibius litoralis TaxID=374515 RepID=A0A967EZS3_9PROT|nr:nucleotidyltransferase [Pelagibius litoralis]
MKTSLDHLPARKRRELKQVEKILHDEFEDALKDSEAAWKKKGRILKIILFGSYARGTWVDEPHTTKGYRSDFDILIVVNNKKLGEYAPYWHKAADRLLRRRAPATPVNFIVHSRREVNAALRKGQYFFSDIRKEGIVLYELDEEPLAAPRPRNVKDAHQTAKEHFEESLPLAQSFLETGISLSRKNQRHQLKHSAFELHQAVEQIYRGLLLTLTNYSPPSHNIKFLRALAEGREPKLAAAWPRDLPRHRAWFSGLAEGYVKARYSMFYQLDADALAWLGACTQQLQKLAERACQKHLAKLVRAAAKR